MSRRILYVQYTNPAAYPPLEHSSRILAEAGWEVLFLGTRRDGTAEICSPRHPRIRERMLAVVDSGWLQKLHYLWFCWSALWTTLWWHPEWLYVSDHNSAPVACAARWIPKVRILFHEHDTPFSGAVPPSGFQRLILAARRAVIRSADLCVWPNRRRAEICASGRKDFFIVWNCPRREEAATPKAAIMDSSALRVFYHGSINAQRVPVSLIQSLPLLPKEVELTVVGYETVGSRGHMSYLLSEATRLGVQDRVHYVGKLPWRSDVLSQCRTADVGLALMPIQDTDINESNMTGASNKPYDYLASGLALLVSDRADWRPMFADPGMALTCNPNEPESIAKALRWFLDHRNETRAMGEVGRQRVLADWNYESQFRPVRERLEESL